MKGRILVIDDEKNVGFVVQTMLEKDGYEVTLSQNSQSAMELLQEDEFDVVLTDLYMPGPGGMEVLNATKVYCPEVSVVIMTAFGTVDSAVQALKAGAFDFITKPFEKADLLDAISKAIRASRTNQAEPKEFLARNPRGDLRPAVPFETAESEELAFPLIGKSALIEGLKKNLRRLADLTDPITFYGESGTGKELIARHTHFESHRAAFPILKVNCALLSSEVLEAEIFGMEGALQKPGKLELAEGGTLIIENLSSAPTSIQEKVYRFLRTGESFSVKGVNARPSNVRIHVLSESSLEKQLNQGKLITELYFVLSPHQILVPRLRDRIEDIESLVDHLLQWFQRKYQVGEKRLDPAFLAGFKTYEWPGNLTQLEKTLERLVLVSEGSVIQITDLPEEILMRLDTNLKEPLITHANLGLKEWVRVKVQQFEKEFIEKALQTTQGNVTKAAEVLKLSRKGLQLKMKELGIRRTYQDDENS
jgi:two-component system, NtrC family, response regulator AtoC